MGFGRSKGGNGGAGGARREAGQAWRGRAQRRTATATHRSRPLPQRAPAAAASPGGEAVPRPLRPAPCGQPLRPTPVACPCGLPLCPAPVPCPYSGPVPCPYRWDLPIGSASSTAPAPCPAAKPPSLRQCGRVAKPGRQLHHRAHAESHGHRPFENPAVAPSDPSRRLLPRPRDRRLASEEVVGVRRRRRGHL